MYHVSRMFVVGLILSSTSLFASHDGQEGPGSVPTDKSLKSEIQLPLSYTDRKEKLQAFDGEKLYGKFLVQYKKTYDHLFNFVVNKGGTLLVDRELDDELIASMKRLNNLTMLSVDVAEKSSDSPEMKAAKSALRNSPEIRPLLGVAKGPIMVSAIPRLKDTKKKKKDSNELLAAKKLLRNTVEMKRKMADLTTNSAIIDYLTYLGDYVLEGSKADKIQAKLLAGEPVPQAEQDPIVRAAIGKMAGEPYKSLQKSALFPGGDPDGIEIVRMSKHGIAYRNSFFADHSDAKAQFIGESRAELAEWLK